MPAYHAAKLQNTALSCCFDTSSLVYLIAWLWVVGPVQSWLARWERSYDLCTNESSCLLLYLANSTISRFPAVLRNVIIIRGLRVAGMGIYVLGAGNGMSSTAAVRECVHGSESVVCMAELRAAAAAAAAHHNAAAARVCMHGWCFDRGKLLCIARNVYSRCGWYRRSPPPVRSQIIYSSRFTACRYYRRRNFSRLSCRYEEFIADLLRQGCRKRALTCGD